jgi:hypothetical protein
MEKISLRELMMVFIFQLTMEQVGQRSTMDFLFILYLPFYLWLSAEQISLQELLRLVYISQQIMELTGQK